jgi:hypothetical protein
VARVLPRELEADPVVRMGVKVTTSALLFATGLVTGAGPVLAGSPSVSPSRANRGPGEKSHGGGVALALHAFAGGFRLCSRPAPEGMGDFWEVQRAEVARIDRVLLRHLRESGLTKLLMTPPENYARQYLGFRRQGRKLIYINALWTHGALSERAATEFQNMCDGGNMAWGIECDIRSNSFAGFRVNGSMSSDGAGPLPTDWVHRVDP